MAPSSGRTGGRVSSAGYAVSGEGKCALLDVEYTNFR